MVERIAEAFEHVAHEYGIENGLKAKCPRCMNYTLGELDGHNLVTVTGMTREQLEAWLEQGPPGVSTLFSSVSAARLYYERYWSLREGPREGWKF